MARLLTLAERDKLVCLDPEKWPTAMLERAKRALAPLCDALPSSTLRDKARLAYLICKEIQDDLTR